jgi:sterol 3beta-glucosyltransferase
MKLTIITGGSQGDVQPLVALGVGLRRAGYRVRLATHPLFEEFVAGRGLEFFSLGGNDPRGVMAAEQKRKRPAGGRLASLWRVLRRPGPSALELRPIEEACRGAEAVVYSPQSGLANLASHVAEKFGLPSFAAYLYPTAPTRAFPSPHAPAGRSLGPTYNLLTHAAARQLFGLKDRAWVNRWRAESLRLPPLSLQRHLRGAVGVPQLYGFSPSVIPRPDDWKEWQHVTGYWFLEEAEDWAAPEGLARFLEEGEPPVYVGFGSMVDPRAEELARVVTEALRLTGRRAVVGRGWGGTRIELPNVYHIEWAPFGWLLGRVAAAVHHAGTGTAAAALRAGVPSVAVPFFGEQRFWAARLYELGVAPAPVPRDKLTARRLAAAVEEAAGDSHLRARAETLGARVRGEDGVGEAVRVIEQYLAAGRAAERGLSPASASHTAPAAGAR